MPDSLSVIIIGRNVKKTLSLCVSSVRKAITKLKFNMDYEIVYVDSMSSDDSLAIAKELDINVIQICGSFHSAALGRSVGLKNSCGRYLMFVDGDMEVAEDWVESAWPYLLEHGAIVGERVDHIYLPNGEITTVTNIKGVKVAGPINPWNRRGGIGGFMLLDRRYICDADFTKELLDEEESDFYAKFGRKIVFWQIPNIAFIHHTGYRSFKDKLDNYRSTTRMTGYVESFIHAVDNGYVGSYCRIQAKYLFSSIGSGFFYFSPIEPLLLILYLLMLISFGLKDIKPMLATSLFFPYKLIFGIRNYLQKKKHFSNILVDFNVIKL